RVLWLSAIVGGLMFGFGMVLASGCGSRSLVRVGGGNLKSLVVLVMLALSAFAALKGITAVIRVGSVDRLGLDLPPGQDLPTLIGAASGQSAEAIAPWTGLAVALLLLLWVVWRAEGRRAEVWIGGVGVGAVIVGL